MLGDSLTAGFGLRPAEALPVRLQSELAALGVSAVVANAGVSGDTTADGLSRIDQDVPTDARLCLVALGANDMMQKAPTAVIRQNLETIVDTLAARGVPVMICGMRAPPWFGPYAVAFDSLFGEVARARGLPFDPFLLEGVALDPALALPDRIHPNALGVETVARRLAPLVVEALERSA
ncbi:MAG: arylesterase [Brevundimonas sp.]|uniref:arylesterase n=1 Tax=Brevundimonas sp. TaxID=1871086 RepID=UPI00391B8054